MQTNDYLNDELTKKTETRPQWSIHLWAANEREMNKDEM